jgi:hypothetical protein
MPYGLVDYSATLCRNRMLFFEMRIAAQLKLADWDEREIKRKVIAENLFQYKNPGGILKSVSMALRRLAVLDHVLLKMLVEAPLEQAKVVALYAILRTDRLFAEFVAEVIREKYLQRQNTVDELDFKVFFREKAEQHETIRQWKPDTFRKLRLAYTFVLAEGGLFNNTTERLITPLLMPPEFKAHLQQIGATKYLELMLG